MKKIKSVIAPDGVFEYVTAGKEYELLETDNNYGGRIKDDAGDRIGILFEKCAFLNTKSWILKYEDEPKEETFSEYKITNQNGESKNLTFPFDTRIVFADGINYNTHNIYQVRSFNHNGIWEDKQIASFPWQVSIIVTNKTK